MYIDHIRLQNFRGFESQRFTLNRGFNVLIGENGSGKTAILRALALGPAALIHLLGGDAEALIEDDDVRWVVFDQGSSVHIEPQPDVEVELRGWIDGQEMTLIVGRAAPTQPGTTIHGLDTLAEPLKTLRREIASGARRPLPLFAYYHTGRLWAQTTQSYDEPTRPGSRVLGYDDCRSPATHVDDLVRWLKTQELIVLQEQGPGGSTGALAAVKRAITASIPGCTDIAFNVRLGELLLTFEEGPKPFHLLSDGVRNMVAMVADIARRAVLLNPYMEADAPSQTAGVVLIDELDLHLHPRWQRRVVDDLREIFPRIQFIATTHSAFIVQALRPGELINLDGRPQLPSGASVEDIAEDVMGVEQPHRSRRHIRRREAAREYFELLDKGADEAKLNQLVAEFADDPAAEALLRAERLVAEMEANG